MTQWQEYQSGKKQLRQHILNHEQHALCLYCERAISADTGVSHIEHVQPKQQYPQLTFDYANLAVSCEGYQLTPSEMADAAKKGHSCGHKKDSEYDSALFLNPLQQENITDYFAFKPHTQLIEATLDRYKAQVDYTVNILRLNESGIMLARQNAVKSFRTVLAKLSNKQQQKQAISKYLNNDKQPFISCLRYHFKRFAA